MKIIDADALIKEIQYYIDEAGWSIAHNEALNWCIEFIEHSPTVEERKTGKWVYGSSVTVKCNQCGFYIPDWEAHSSRFCRNCGAKMEG